MMLADSLELDQPHTEVARSSWIMSSMILTGEIMGTGVLGLPYAASRLGWLLGLGSCGFFALTATYSGLLLSRTRSLYADKDASSYADLALLTVGPRFAHFTRACILVTWAAMLPYYLLSSRL